ncbi:hypothetical protein Y032_0081g1492 [Ancylostoma ceylanicum]|uniref:Uncharacterized protein n=1 Tax=Ancylostoma ceylanicum TaxID=53326 RepID=A0A016TRI9_9BILA|nr:hypothetical protein Y032_0081g1492 [Ancylostoma ceylanicum]
MELGRRSQLGIISRRGYGSLELFTVSEDLYQNSYCSELKMEHRQAMKSHVVNPHWMANRKFYSSYLRITVHLMPKLQVHCTSDEYSPQICRAIRVIQENTLVW